MGDEGMNKNPGANATEVAGAKQLAELQREVSDLRDEIRALSRPHS